MEFKYVLAAAAEQRLKEIMANREKLVMAWIAETGLLPSESEIVETSHPDGSMSVHVRRLTPVDR